MPGPMDLFAFDIQDVFATGLQPVESHPDYVRLTYTAMSGNECRPVASIVMTLTAFNEAVRKFLEVDGLPAN